MLDILSRAWSHKPDLTIERKWGIKASDLFHKQKMRLSIPHLTSLSKRAVVAVAYESGASAYGGGAIPPRGDT